jgi:hypothetical protein
MEPSASKPCVQVATADDANVAGNGKKLVQDIKDLTPKMDVVASGFVGVFSVVIIGTALVLRMTRCVHLRPGEFIALIVAGLIVMVIGVTYRLSVYMKAAATARHVWDRTAAANAGAASSPPAEPVSGPTSP